MTAFPPSFRPISKENKSTIGKSLPASFKPIEKKEEIPDFFEEGFGPEFERETERHQARNLSRFVESTLGLPGDIASFATGLFGKEQHLLPTSEKLQKLSEMATSGYTIPKNELEKTSDELFKDIGVMLFPGAKQYNILRNIGIPVVANLAKEGLKYSGADDKSSSYFKIGTMVFLDLLSNRKGGVKKYASNLFNEAEKLVPETAKADATFLMRSLSKLRENLQMGGERPSTVKALKKISEIEAEIKDGQIGMKNLMAYRPAINEIVSEFGGFEVQLPKQVRQKAIRNLHDVKRATIEAAEDWGKQHSPEFVKMNRSANEAWAAYENSNKITKFIEKHAGKYAGPLSKALFGLGHVTGGAGAILAPSTIIPMALTTSGYQVFKMLNRAKNSKTLRNYYSEILSGAANRNSGQVISNMKALDKALQEENQ